MIDHILGRPSTRFRKYQVFAVVLFWSLYLRKFKRHGPPGVDRLSKWLSGRFNMHQALVVSCMALYVSRNFARVVGLESPEPLANLYDKKFFRATWITTALDAGFWTAMHLRPKWLRHSCEIIFTLYYLVCAEQADEMVRRVRGDLRVEHLRVSWNKPNTPVLKFFTSLMRPKLMKHEPRKIKIHRPRDSDYKEPIDAWLYFNGSDTELRRQREIVLDIPGGGFVAMDPRCHDDKLMSWAGKLGCPVLALDYKKAPGECYPYQLYECYDTYYQLVMTRGRCINLSGEHIPKIIISGDSAGGNLAAGTVLMILDEKSQHSTWHTGFIPNALPPPEAVVLIYPALELNIGIWMSDEHLALMNSLKRNKDDKRVLDRKTEDYRRIDRTTPYTSDAEDSDDTVTPNPRRKSSVAQQPEKRMKTRLAMSSVISYTNDRIISPEMLRAMIIVYIGPHRRPDFTTDYWLSPVRAPEELLAKFPKTFLICGERDPLVDDTQIFAGRLRQAKLLEFNRRKEVGLINEEAVFNDDEHFKKIIVPQISHGFLQFVSLYHDGWEWIHECRRFMQEAFIDAYAREPSSVASTGGTDYFSNPRGTASRRGSHGSDSERPLEIPSKFRMTKIDSGGVASPQQRRTNHSRSGSGSGRHSAQANGSLATAPNSRRNGMRMRRNHHMSGAMSPSASRNVVNRLASSEDLLERRMRGMTGPLLGDTKDD
ncbi:Putative alpha/beta hydrolase-3, lipase, GDXG serine active [Septoria linicola]|uniref:Alpha/beta hydrolase-3, lipase, GDXG serine active n=1 Tax=Septoria linicola TaxID=215465 RepID=A0A9Q9AFB3_9PEZI|nr:Putative alpha/beta hydrolase-3, lipase, GDXG serine active [Septoria linicola]